MTSREFVEIQSGLRGPFGKWLMQYLKAQGTDIQSTACSLVPQTLGEQIEREQSFGRAKALLELVDQIPNTIDETLKKLKEQEHE